MVFCRDDDKDIKTLLKTLFATKNSAIIGYSQEMSYVYISKT